MTTQNMRAQLITRVVPLLTFSLVSLHSFAAQAAQNCIELKNEAQIEQEYTDDKGQKAKRLVAPGKIVPGNEVIYTITARNLCDKPVDKVVVNNPVPEHTTYVNGSAMGTGTDISYSLDGNSFAKHEALVVKNSDGSTRAARAEDIKQIRWVYTTPINPGQVAFVRFRTTVN